MCLVYCHWGRTNYVLAVTLCCLCLCLCLFLCTGCQHVRIDWPFITHQIRMCFPDRTEVAIKSRYYELATLGAGVFPRAIFNPDSGTTAAGVDEPDGDGGSNSKPLREHWGMDEHMMLYECKLVHRNNYAIISAILNDLFHSSGKGLLRTPQSCSSHYRAYIRGGASAASTSVAAKGSRLPEYDVIPPWKKPRVSKTLEMNNFFGPDAGNVQEDFSAFGRRAAHWEPYEDLLLKSSFESRGNKSWRSISELFPGRTATACKQRYYNGLRNRIGVEAAREVEHRDDHSLSDGDSDMDSDGDGGAGRGDDGSMYLLHHANKNMAPTRADGSQEPKRPKPWTAEEDQLIRDNLISCANWAHLCKVLSGYGGGRTIDSIRRRWTQYLAPREPADSQLKYLSIGGRRREGQLEESDLWQIMGSDERKGNQDPAVVVTADLTTTDSGFCNPVSVTAGSVASDSCVTPLGPFVPPVTDPATPTTLQQGGQGDTLTETNSCFGEKLAPAPDPDPAPVPVPMPVSTPTPTSGPGDVSTPNPEFVPECAYTVSETEAGPTTEAEPMTIMSHQCDIYDTSIPQSNASNADTANSGSTCTNTINNNSPPGSDTGTGTSSSASEDEMEIDI